MEIKNARKATVVGDGDLTLVKAAAWAWHQHGSGNHWKPFRDADADPYRISPVRRQPTRYKLEAIRAAESESFLADSDFFSSGSDPSPALSSGELIDLYEVDRISRQLERLITGVETNGRVRAESKRKAAAKRVNGFWIPHGVGACRAGGDVVQSHVVGVCRARGDVVPAHVIGGRRPVKAPAVV